jgi:integrase
MAESTQEAQVRWSACPHALTVAARAGRQLPQQPPNRRSQRRGVQRCERDAGVLGAQQDPAHLVRIRLPIRRYEVEAGVGQVPQGHRASPDCGDSGMLRDGGERPGDAAIRRALLRYAFNSKQRNDAPDNIAEVLACVARHSARVSALAEPATARRLLDQATCRVDGKNAAASTARRHRTILANAMDYAIELRLVDANPIRGLKWSPPKVSSQVDRRSVVNPRQAQALLEAVRAQQPSGARLVAFFAVMYYAGLRPEEAINLHADDLVLAAQARQDARDDDDWGELHLRTATPDAGSDWTDDGSQRERRQLKHRAEGDIRIVPTHPELTRLLRDHLASFGTAADGRLFVGVRGGELPTITYRRAWIKARQAALTASEQASPLVRRPYDLRHACLSTWLNGGVYPTQVAEWAGHSVDVLLRIYAKCIVGQDELAKRRISDALRQD